MSAWEACIEDDEVEEGHEDMDDKASNALQLAHNSLGVLQRERQMLPLLQVVLTCEVKHPENMRQHIGWLSNHKAHEVHAQVAAGMA